VLRTNCAFAPPNRPWPPLTQRPRSTRQPILVVQTVWAENIQSTTDAGSLNTFGRNEIEVAPISSALLPIACLVILYKTCCGPRTRSRWGIRTGMRFADPLSHPRARLAGVIARYDATDTRTHAHGRHDRCRV